MIEKYTNKNRVLINVGNTDNINRIKKYIY